MDGAAERREIELEVADRGRDRVSALLVRPANAHWLLVLGHGAGAGMHHPFLEAVAQRLAEHRVATLRYQFPYMQAGRRRPDRQPVLLATVHAAIALGRQVAGPLPLFAGGKSMGGRMTSLAAADEALGGVRGLVFLGFPLHPAGAPDSERGEHLRRVDVPLLFLQGDRDKLAGLDLLRPLVDDLGDRATLHVEAGADHSFHVLQRSGRNDDEVLEALAAAAAAWMDGIAPG